jgi:hypothetical protein
MVKGFGLGGYGVVVMVLLMLCAFVCLNYGFVFCLSGESVYLCA